MKYQVFGARVLLKVNKFKRNIPGSIIELPDEVVDMETANQTEAEVVQYGAMAFKRSENAGETIKVGDIVHINRHGAIRLNYKEEKDVEYWVIMDKDILCKEV